MDTNIVEYNYGDDFEVTPAIKEDFEKYGYVIIRGILDGEELTLLKTAIEQSDVVKNGTFYLEDGEGLEMARCMWNNVSDDVTGFVVRSQKVAGTAEALLGGEVYPYHIKLSLKEAHTGGAVPWHQDYGYWYEHGCLFPNMGTIYIALDDATKENGCLKIIAGSHKAGRVDHVTKGRWVSSDPDRIEQLKNALPLVHAELRAGDSIFFHCNILHCSDQNTSPHRRWGFLAAYNVAHNEPGSRQGHGHASAKYSKMEKVPNSAIKAASKNLQGIKMIDYLGIKNSPFDSVQKKIGLGTI